MKMKMPYKNALFEYFSAVILKKLLPCLKSAASICQKAVFLEKQTSFKFRTKNVLFARF